MFVKFVAQTPEEFRFPATAVSKTAWKDDVVALVLVFFFALLLDPATLLAPTVAI